MPTHIPNPELNLNIQKKTSELFFFFGLDSLKLLDIFIIVALFGPHLEKEKCITPHTHTLTHLLHR